MPFNTVEEVTRWRKFSFDGVTYDLSHLDAHLVEYTYAKDGEKPVTYKYIVTYGLHCFAKDTEDILSDRSQSLMYKAPRESRPFNFERYSLSKQLPSIIQLLGDKETLVFHAGYGKFATFRICDSEGKEVEYFVAFAVFREKKKLRLHVQSAYPKDERMGKIQKVGFFTISRNLLSGKPLPKPLK